MKVLDRHGDSVVVVVGMVELVLSRAGSTQWASSIFWHGVGNVGREDL